MSTEVTSSSGTSGRQQLQHQPTAFCNDDLYNPALTYEQRARIRQLKRKAKTSGDLVSRYRISYLISGTVSCSWCAISLACAL